MECPLTCSKCCSSAGVSLIEEASSGEIIGPRVPLRVLIREMSLLDAMNSAFSEVSAQITCNATLNLGLVRYPDGRNVCLYNSATKGPCSAVVPKKSAKEKGIPDWLQPSLYDQTKADQEVSETDRDSHDIETL